jgi:hypothetical protein
MATKLVWRNYKDEWWSAVPADAEYTDMHASVVKMHCGNYRAKLRDDPNFMDMSNPYDAQDWCEVMFNLKGVKYERKD